ncbi:MAG: penicillin-binding protein 2 [Phycisphaerales bacterium]|nr:penicillin-binding protein 2 [Phycisphaerales bacterium]
MPPEPAGTVNGRPDRAVVVSRLFAGLATAVLVLVVARVAQLKLQPGDDLSRYISERVGREREPSPRGDLLDRRGRPLSMSEVGFRVVIDPVGAESNMDRVIVALAESLGLPAEEIGEPLVRAVAMNTRIRSTWDEKDVNQTGGGARTFVTRLVGAIRGDEAGLDPVLPGLSQTAETRRLRRYLPVGPVLDREIATLVENLGLPGVAVEKQLVRRYPGGDEIASILGKVGYGHAGLLGAERNLDERLRGEDGRIGFVHDARNQPVMIDASASMPGERGEDVRLSIDLELQRIAITELERGMEDADAAGGRLVMMRPATGEILAMVDLYREVEGLVPFPWVEPGTPKAEWPELPPEGERPRYVTLPADDRRATHPAMGRNRCVEDIYEPGSTFKRFVWACAWQAGVIGEGEIIETRPYVTPFGRRFEDVTKRDRQTWEEVLVHSSNVGMVKMSERLSHEQLRSFVERFGFGSRTRIGLTGEASGMVTNEADWTIYTHSSVVIGHEVAVTPVQMVRAFGAYARTGVLAGTLPHPRMTSPTPEELTAEPLVRVLEPAVATRTRRVLVRVAERMDEGMRRRFPGEPTPGYTLFGKSGTADIPVVAPVVRDDEGKPVIDERGRVVRMGKPKGAGGYYDEQYNSSFIAGAPADNPTIVVLVVIDDPGPARVRQKQHYGSAVAGPVVRRVVERSLRYLGVPPAEMVAAGQ